MTTALVVGVGAVGTRAARQLIDTPGIDRLLLADRDDTQLAEVADALGPDAGAIDFAPGDPIPSDVDVVATALPGGVDHPVVSAAIAAGVPVASSDDEHDAIEQLRALSPNARGAEVTIAVGCGLAPGLADVLASHAATMFEKVDEIRVARTGWGGPACVDTVRHERRVLVHTWHDGSWREEHPTRRQPRVVPRTDRRPRLPHGHRGHRAARRRVRRRAAHQPAGRRAAQAGAVPPPVR